MVVYGNLSLYVIDWAISVLNSKDWERSVTIYRLSVIPLDMGLGS